MDNQEQSLLFRGPQPQPDLLDEPRRHAGGRPARRHRHGAHRRHARRRLRAPRARHYAVQFHPEVTHTPWGTELLRNFVHGACRARGDWTMGNFIEMAARDIREQIDGGGEVICAVCGGVDSLCTAALVDRAVGERLSSIFVDHGMLRPRRATKWCRPGAGTSKSKLVRVNAGQALPRRAQGRGRAGAQAPDHRPRVHPRLRGRGARSCPPCATWRRARSTPT